MPMKNMLFYVKSSSLFDTFLKYLFNIIQVSSVVSYKFVFKEFCKNIIFTLISRLVIGTSRTVGSAKKFVRITSGFWWKRVHEDASQGMYMSKIEIFFFTARILQNQRMLCCGECFHD